MVAHEQLTEEASGHSLPDDGTGVVEFLEMEEFDTLSAAEEDDVDQGEGNQIDLEIVSASSVTEIEQHDPL